MNEKTPNYNILIIDNDEEFRISLCDELTSYFTSCKHLDQSKVFDCINSIQSDYDLVILSVQIENALFEKVKSTVLNGYSTHLILVSNTDNVSLREINFKDGILDFHLKSNPVGYIADDIIESLDRVAKNHQETILIMESSLELCNTLKLILNKRNFKVLTANYAKDGIKYISEYEISILVLDMNLPDIKGIDILIGLRDLFMINKFPILVTSNSSNPSVVRQALKKGASEFINKPIRYEEFLLKIDRWIKTSVWQKTIKEQKEQIENSLETFEALVNSSIEAMFIFKNELCVKVNTVALSLLESKYHSDILNLELVDIFRSLSKSNLLKLQDKMSNCMFEDIIVTKSAKQKNIQVKVVNIQLKAQRLKIVTIMDITQIKQNEKMLFHQTKMASMGEMISNIAHQWRQPLTAISISAGSIKLNYELNMVDIDETFRELDNIVNNTQFLSNTIEDFQNFLKENRSLSSFLLKDTITKTFTIIKGNLESSEIEVLINNKETIQLNGVQNDLIQVFLNIINNAIDILKTQSKTTKVILIDTYATYENVIISFQDSAGGVDRAIIDKIFDPYFTTKHQSQGTGLGLFMTHRIIESLNGSITVENCEFSHKGKNLYGANFTVKLPISMRA